MVIKIERFFSWHGQSSKTQPNGAYENRIDALNADVNIRILAK